MGAHRLPGRIALVLIGSIVMSTLTVAASVGWMANQLDRQAHGHNVALAENARSDLLAQLRILLLDYAKWEAAIPEVSAANLPWIYDNIGASAVTGRSFQITVLWGGPFADDLGWRLGGPEEPKSGILDPHLLGLVERGLLRIPLNVYRGLDFFAWERGALYVMGAARFEPDDPVTVAQAIGYDRMTPRILLGRRVTADMLGRIGNDLLLSGLRVAHAAPSGGNGLPLLGVDGRPIAWLTWDISNPGTAMLRHMALPLFFVSVLTSGLVASGMMLLRRSARMLVAGEKEASRSARTDALTGLPNRLAFAEALDQPARAGERAILFLDVNGFKRINDSFGHPAGDRLVAMMAARLNPLIGADGLLARIAGDEFVLLLSGPDAEVRIRALAHRIGKALEDAFDLMGRDVRISVAIGYAVQGPDGMSGADLVRQANLAMYEAKRRKESGPIAFGAVLEGTSRDALALEQNLRRAIAEGNGLSVAYQPIVDRNRRMVRAEALARWTCPISGPVPPDCFIAVAERAGLIVELGQQLLDIVWDDLERHPDLTVSVNVSPLQLLSPDFVPRLISTAAQRGIASGGSKLS